MSTIHDLRETLDRHAATVPHDAGGARTAAIGQRVRVVRRRRAAGGLATVAVLATVLGGVSLLPGADRTSPRPDDLAPAVPADPDATGAGPSFPARLPDGAVRTAVAVGDPGETTLRFSVVAGEQTLRWVVHCAPENAGRLVVRFNGDERMRGACGSFDAEPGSAWSSFDDLRARDGSIVGPGDRVRVTVRLQGRPGSASATSRTDVRLAAGAYEGIGPG